MDTTTPKKPDPFLKDGGGDVSINDAGDWAAILHEENLAVNTSAASTDAVVSWASSNGIQFSSQGNAAYFLGQPVSTTAESSAWVGDAFKCWYSLSPPYWQHTDGKLQLV
jgi:hypothetical protein